MPQPVPCSCVAIRAGGLALAGIVSNDREEALSPAGALIGYDPLIDDGRTAPHGYRFTTTWACR